MPVNWRRRMRNVQTLLREQAVCAYLVAPDEPCALSLGHNGFHQAAGGTVPKLAANFNGEGAFAPSVAPRGYGEAEFTGEGHLQGAIHIA